MSVLDHRLIKDRLELDGELVRLFRADQVELVVMAGWMRIVTEVLISGYSDRLINIHPSLLPSFRGLDAIGNLIKGQAGQGVQCLNLMAGLAPETGLPLQSFYP